MQRHHHSGKSSVRYLDYKKIISHTILDSDENVVDIGCGMGDFVLELNRYKNFNRIYAIDIYKEGIKRIEEKILEERIDRIITLNEDFTARTSLPDSFFDVAYMINVMHGFVVNEETEKVIPELKRILKSKGRVVIVEFKKYVPFLGPPISERVSSRELIRIFENYGFNKVSIRGLGLSHYMAIFSK